MINLKCGADSRTSLKERWLKWHLKHGGSPRPPRIIIDGIPFPEIVRLELDFGNVLANEGPLEMPLPGWNIGA